MLNLKTQNTYRHTFKSASPQPLSLCQKESHSDHNQIIIKKKNYLHDY